MDLLDLLVLGFMGSFVVGGLMHWFDTTEMGGWA
jgi:hypothetical protein